jgi:bifunctional UDP-N-acetylglucosamine pyrophosphorylase/glucosamine-1-phosphate N-acetyltransferase
MSKLNIVILAAGQGTRMKSQHPKVLHPLGGRPLLGHVIETARSLKPEKIIVVYGHGGEQVPAALDCKDVTWVEQAEQLGTGHAVEQAMPEIDDNSTVLILYGDVPLLRDSTRAELVRIGESGFGLLTVHVADPGGYGRIVRDQHGAVERIVEEKDANEHERRITEVNSGIMCTSAKQLRAWLSQLENENAQKEYYLTDTIAMAVKAGIAVTTAHPEAEEEVAGVNSRSQLAELERYYQRQLAEQLMAAGVTISDPARLDIRGEVTSGQDVTLDVNVVLIGKVRLGNNVSIGPGCVIKESEIGDNVEIKAMSVIEESVIESGAMVGPFARLRPGARLAADVHIGNYVEIKNSHIGKGSKVNHLTYIGDTTMGSGVNIGAGTITANYDGANKHRTIIEDNASVGSNSVLVAPVKVRKDATLGAGTVLRKQAPEGELTMSVSKQKTISGWKRPKKKS